MFYNHIRHDFSESFNHYGVAWALGGCILFWALVASVVVFCR